MRAMRLEPGKFGDEWPDLSSIAYPKKRALKRMLVIFAAWFAAAAAVLVLVGLLWLMVSP